MSFVLRFAPILLFILVFVGSGIYFTLLGTPNAFYQLSPITAIIPAIAFAWVLHRGTTQQKMHDFLDGIRHRDIITMCIVFLLAGAFSEVTKQIGSIEATVNFALTFIPHQFLLIGLFLVAAFVSTSIGTSMGTIATIAPISFALSQQLGIYAPLCMATVIGGAMFGDNLSIISDTTIAAVMSQGADMKLKLKLNVKIAFIASIITICLLAFKTNAQTIADIKDYNMILVAPYILLIVLAVSGINVFVSLSLSIAFAGIIGALTSDNFGIIIFNQSLNKGFISMNEIMLLSLMIGGLSGLTGKEFALDVANGLSTWLDKKNAGPKFIQLLIAKLVSIFDILLANNTIAIIFTGKIAKELIKKYKIPAHYSAAWLDIFSCVFQGLIPYGAQILLASAIAQVSPLTIVPYVYYCYILYIVSVGYILFTKIRR
ncbi:Sodium:proton antiporter family protein [Candidatus Cyrtobacter comes]|uniref:Sodium:proton antiporter family protein n=1 Tax=Candidatus Cyrtobacter comes TaxID=675776 RepID=A0ABU5L8E8_9RICK|nr:Na+/H+ antiporter NhaC family protein [Candidatus Cyrtobacter comes]MDZ5762129.1 Sodium:proton antiporter family protein [Candidatus Cyrtobacter comes]